MADAEPVAATAIRELAAAIRALSREVRNLRDRLIVEFATASAERAEYTRVAAEQRDALRALAPAAPEPDPVGDAADALKVQAIGKVGGLLDLPGRAWAALTWAVASPKNAAQAALMLGGVATVLRVLSGIVPGLEPVADALQAVMDAISPPGSKP